MKITIATMLMCGGDIQTVYGIFQGTLRMRKGKPYSFDINNAEHVGRCVNTERRTMTPDDYYRMAQRHETKQFPAFAWNRA